MNTLNSLEFHFMEVRGRYVLFLTDNLTGWMRSYSVPQSSVTYENGEVQNYVTGRGRG